MRILRVIRIIWITIVFTSILWLIVGCFKACSQCKQLDIIVLVDYSGSVNTKEKFIVDALFAFVNKFELDEQGIKIGVISFNDKASVEAPLSSDIESIKQELKYIHLKIASGGTAMHLGLLECWNEFSKNGRDGYQKILIIVSDGNVDEPLITSTMIKQFDYITVCSILIDLPLNKPDFMEKISDNCYVKTDYESLVSQLRELNFCL